MGIAIFLDNHSSITNLFIFSSKVLFTHSNISSLILSNDEIICGIKSTLTFFHSTLYLQALFTFFLNSHIFDEFITSTNFLVVLSIICLVSISGDLLISGQFEPAVKEKTRVYFWY